MSRVKRDNKKKFMIFCLKYLSAPLTKARKPIPEAAAAMPDGQIGYSDASAICPMPRGANQSRPLAASGKSPCALIRIF
jgi:hypothetical protein